MAGALPSDTAKLVALCLAENVTDEHQLDRYRIRFQYPDQVEIPGVHNPCLPHISISTTLSAGEFTNFAGATDEERKVKDLYTGEGLWVSAAFLDPVVTTATPGWLWASTGIRAVDHAIETVCSRISFPFSDGLALEALRLLQQHLPASAGDRNNLESSGYCQVAAWMSIYNLTNVQVGLSHGLGHQLGARNDVPHGVTSCIMLPRVMEFNRSVTAPQQRRIAEAMGADTRNASDDEAAAAAVSALEDLIDTLGIPRRLSDWGVSEAGPGPHSPRRPGGPGGRHQSSPHSHAGRGGGAAAPGALGAVPRGPQIDLGPAAPQRLFRPLRPGVSGGTFLTDRPAALRGVPSHRKRRLRRGEGAAIRRPLPFVGQFGGAGRKSTVYAELES